MNQREVIAFFNRCAPEWDAANIRDDGKIGFILDAAGIRPGCSVLDKTTPRLIQFHTLKNAVNPPFLGGFSIFNTVVA
jgi:hypothetical protein